MTIKHALGDKALLYAMIERALLDMTGNTGLKAGINESVNAIASAFAWVKSFEDDEMSFVWCCEHLDLDPEYLRFTMLDKAEEAHRNKKPLMRTTRCTGWHCVAERALDIEPDLSIYFE